MSKQNESPPVAPSPGLYGEPWTTVVVEGPPRIWAADWIAVAHQQIGGVDRLERACECVNACEGIEDPRGWRDQRRALLEALFPFARMLRSMAEYSDLALGDKAVVLRNAGTGETLFLADFRRACEVMEQVSEG